MKYEAPTIEIIRVNAQADVCTLSDQSGNHIQNAVDFSALTGNPQ